MRISKSSVLLLSARALADTPVNRDVVQLPLVDEGSDSLRVHLGIGVPPKDFKFEAGLFPTRSQLKASVGLYLVPEGEKASYVDASFLKSGSNVDENTGELTYQSANVTAGGRSLGKLKLWDMNWLPDSDNLRDGMAKLDLSTFPKELHDEKLVKSESFSVARRDHGGALTFGGYDKAKFHGPLEKHSLVGRTHRYGGPYQFHVKSLGYARQERNELMKELEVGLDLSSNALRLHASVLEKLLDLILPEHAEARTESYQNSNVVVPCAMLKTRAALEFKLTERTTISIPLSDLKMQESAGDAKCTLAITELLPPPEPVPGQEGQGPHVTIGTHFLRRSYVVNSLGDKNTLFIAEEGNCGQNLVTIVDKMPEEVVVGDC